jgi:hypothetical protein
MQLTRCSDLAAVLAVLVTLAVTLAALALGQW